MEEMICPYCKKPAEWVENKAVYGKNYGRSYMIYLCRNCDAYVGCHNNTKVPLGTMANKELREMRKTVHKKIDPLWREGKFTRKTVYLIISSELGREFHAGESDIETCRKVLNFVENNFYGAKK